MKPLAALAVLVLASCNDDDDTTTNNPNSVQVIAEVTATSTSGDWRVTSFVDDGVDKTSFYQDYTFTFNANGTLTAITQDNGVAGFWSVTNDDDDDDVNTNTIAGVEYNLQFTASNILQELSDDWDIIAYSQTTIELTDDDDDNDNDTDYLTFQKI